MSSFERIELVNNKERNRFEFQLNNLTAFAEYIVNGNSIIIYNTHIPQVFSQEKGFSELFLQKIMIKVESANMLLDVQCPYMRAILKRINPLLG